MTAPRRTQAERSAGTQQALVDAAIDSLVDQGWAATTAVEVCARAGVTRGALHHHFPSLSSLLARSLEEIYDEIATGEHPNDLTGLVDALERALANPRFPAVIEAWLAAGNDRELAREIGPVIERFAKAIAPTERLMRDDDAAVTFSFSAREAVIGLALGRATAGGPLDHEPRVIADLRSRAAILDADHRTPEETS